MPSGIYIRTEEHNRNIARVKLGITKRENPKLTGGVKKGSISWCKGLTKETDSRLMKISKALKGRLFSDEWRRNMSIAQIKRVRTPEEHAKRTRAMRKPSYRLLARQKGIARWKDPGFVSKMMKKFHAKPNGLEIKLLNILDEHFSDYWKYIGDGQDALVGSKISDFAEIHRNNLFLELNGRYWHPDPNEEFDLIKHYKKYGKTVLVIWEEELEDVPALIAKIRTFMEDNNDNLLV